MYRNQLRILFLISLASLIMGQGISAFGDGRGSSRGDVLSDLHDGGRADGRKFLMGVCVGETLAQSGLLFSDLSPANSSASTIQALQQAELACRSQMANETPTPSPSPSASTAG